MHCESSLAFLLSVFISVQRVSSNEVFDSSHTEEHLHIVSVIPNAVDISVLGGQGCLIENDGHDSCKNETEVTTVKSDTTLDPVFQIPSECRMEVALDCSGLPSRCLNCTHSYQCAYGELTNATCRVMEGVDCKGDRLFNKTFICQYCYQTNASEHVCSGSSSCKSASAPRQSYLSNCSVLSNITCLGHRQFFKKLPCNWTSGYRWSTAFLLSIFGGGFGADRFYLGYWQEGIGKLFSFGGLGVWTLVDVVLIGVRFLGPADGSLYVD